MSLNLDGALAQNAPVSPDRPWHTSAEFNLEDVENIQESGFQIDSSRTYSLAELIDLAETHNPATRAFWEGARAQAANSGISRSELCPTLAAAALSQTTRSEAFFGSRFYAQITQEFQVELDLNYTNL
jgi:outer membrane protein